MNYICLATNAQKNVAIWREYSRLDCNLKIMCLKKSLKTIYYSVVHSFKCSLSEPVKISLHFESNANISFVVFGFHLLVDRGQEMQRYVHFITCWFSPTLTPFRKLMICGFYFTEISTVLPLLCDQLPVATSLKAWGFCPTDTISALFRVFNLHCGKRIGIFRTTGRINRMSKKAHGKQSLFNARITSTRKRKVEIISFYVKLFHLFFSFTNCSVNFHLRLIETPCEWI